MSGRVAEAIANLPAGALVALLLGSGFLGLVGLSILLRPARVASEAKAQIREADARREGFDVGIERAASIIEQIAENCMNGGGEDDDDGLAGLAKLVRAAGGRPSSRQSAPEDRASDPRTNVRPGTATRDGKLN